MTNETQQARRAAFELFCELMTSTARMRKGDGYADQYIQLMWIVWNAALDTVVIELPGSPYMPDVEPESLTDYERGEAQGRCDLWANCRDAIHAAGVKTR